MVASGPRLPSTAAQEKCKGEWQGDEGEEERERERYRAGMRHHTCVFSAPILLASDDELKQNQQQDYRTAIKDRS